jgi:hypothetical protein
MYNRSTQITTPDYQSDIFYKYLLIYQQDIMKMYFFGAVMGQKLEKFIELLDINNAIKSVNQQN